MKAFQTFGAILSYQFKHAVDKVFAASNTPEVTYKLMIHDEVTQMNGSAKGDHLKIRIKRQIPNDNTPQDDIVRLYVSVPQKGSYPSERRIVANIDCSTLTAYENGLQNLKDHFYTECTNAKPDFLSTLTQELK